jgi:hypothetical protein
MKPFSIAIDREGDAWVTGSYNGTLAEIDPAGNVVQVIPSAGSDGDIVLSRPLGDVSDSHGNIWVANSDFMDVPCPPTPTPTLGAANAPSITLFKQQSGGEPPVATTFTGGGLTIPWGIAVDGADTVWVANFGYPFTASQPTGPADWPAPNAISQFCGAAAAKCPPGKQQVGMAISPETGYTSDAMERITAVAIDPSGNVWLANNWKKTPVHQNPGENSLAVIVGAATPLRTPVIGTPRGFGGQKVRGGTAGSD